MLKVANSVINASRITGVLPVVNGGTGVTTSTGTTNVVLSNSPTITTPTIAGATLSGTVSGGGNQINNVVIGASSPLAGNFTTGAFSDTVTSTKTNGYNWSNISATTGLNIARFTGSNSDLFWGTENSAGNGVIYSGGTAYAAFFGTNNFNTPVQIMTGSVVRGTFSTTGLAVSGVLSATGVVTFSNYGAGTATFSAAGVISSVSDETWKIKDGVPTDPDAMLKKLEPGYWYYNDEKKETFGTDRQLGFYAQNVNAAIGPEAAPTPEEGKPWGYYDRAVLAITVMSLQKALATIESLTARITALETAQP